jgi:hypothetical protein
MSATVFSLRQAILVLLVLLLATTDRGPVKGKGKLHLFKKWGCRHFVYILASPRVARFFMVQNTKTRK